MMKVSKYWRIIDFLSSFARDNKRRFNMAKTSASIQRRRAIRAAEHKRDALIEKLAKAREDLQKARLELKQVKAKS